MDGLTFRGFLIALRKNHREEKKKYFLYTGLLSLGFIVVTLGVDYLAPFEGWFMLIRSLLLIPTAITVYSLIYGLSLDLHYRKMENDPDWIPYRVRFSPKTRLQLSLIVGAFIFVLIVSTGQGVGYTAFSSIVAVMIIATLAFMRPTVEEQRRTKTGVPDVRDLNFDLNKRALERERLLREKAKKNSRK